MNDGSQGQHSDWTGRQTSRARKRNSQYSLRCWCLAQNLSASRCRSCRRTWRWSPSRTHKGFLPDTACREPLLPEDDFEWWDAYVSYFMQKNRHFPKNAKIIILFYHNQNNWLTTRLSHLRKLNCFLFHAYISVSRTFSQSHILAQNTLFLSKNGLL